MTTVNTNALPVAGIQRLEVLTDGASAIYGSDAVAGVINTILDTDYEGLQASFRYGTAENTELDEQRIIIKAGKNFNGGRTNLSFFGEYSRAMDILLTNRHSVQTPICVRVWKEQALRATRLSITALPVLPGVSLH